VRVTTGPRVSVGDSLGSGVWVSDRVGTEMLVAVRPGIPVTAGEPVAVPETAGVAAGARVIVCPAVAGAAGTSDRVGVLVAAMVTSPTAVPVPSNHGIAAVVVWPVPSVSQATRNATAIDTRPRVLTKAHICQTSLMLTEIIMSPWRIASTTPWPRTTLPKTVCLPLR
jgi:hypothetical protein